MARLAPNILKTAAIGKHSDGGGVYLLVTDRDGAGRAKGSWIFRYTYLKLRYEMGLGSIQSLTLARARAECVALNGIGSGQNHIARMGFE